MRGADSERSRVQGSVCFLGGQRARHEKDKGLRTQVLTGRALRTIVGVARSTRCEDVRTGSRSTRVLPVRVGCSKGKGSEDEVEELEGSLISLADAKTGLDVTHPRVVNRSDDRGAFVSGYFVSKMARTCVLT